MQLRNPAVINFNAKPDFSSVIGQERMIISLGKSNNNGQLLVRDSWGRVIVGMLCGMESGDKPITIQVDSLPNNTIFITSAPYGWRVMQGEIDYTTKGVSIDIATQITDMQLLTDAESEAA